jgi:hypothetical protein
MMAYLELVAELAGAARRRDADLAAVEQSYVDGTDSAEAELAAANEAARTTARRAASIATTVAEVDRDADRLWRTLRGSVGWRGRRLGATPEPAATVESEAKAPLRRAAERLAGANAKQDHGKHLPRRVLPLLPGMGAGAAALVACLAAGLLVPGAAVSTVLGQLVFFLAPFAGLPVSAAWVNRRYAARLDTGAIGLTVLGGMLACTLFMLTLH